ncbi:hypothetical protein CNY67_13610 [Desulfovibrio sp. G11]|nr:hypothetical protein CNY67_13610 [Desulfovibrio sp. G11]
MGRYYCPEQGCNVHCQACRAIPYGFCKKLRGTICAIPAIAVLQRSGKTLMQKRLLFQKRSLFCISIRHTVPDR